MSFRDVMEMPLRTFWCFNANVLRLRAEENIHAIELFLMGGFGVTEEMVTGLRNRLSEQMKEPIKAQHTAPKLTPEDNLAQHREGFAKLRDILNRK
jgi:hypothetical protein